MVRVENLVKEFRHTDAAGKAAVKRAVDGLSFAVARGEIFGLLGPNGAGKTTTIRMLTMLTQPTSGAIFYEGRPLAGNEAAVKELIGVVPQQVNFDQDLTAGENLELHARLHHIGAAERRARIEELLAFVELEGVRRDPVRRLSGGMKRRLLIARALVHRPRILFLDEPTVALDPQVRRRIWELIRQMAHEGVTVLLTTHYIEEAESLCARVAIMNRGKLAALDAPAALRERLGDFVVEWDGEVGREYRYFAGRKDAAAFAAALDGAASIRRSNLEDAFIELTGRKEGL